MKSLLLHRVLQLMMVFTFCQASIGNIIAQTTDGGAKKAKSDSAAKATYPDTITNKYVQPKDIEEYLNQISNPDLPRDIRKKWKEEALQLFAHGSVQVLDEKNCLGNRYTAAALLDLLVDFPHRVKVNEILRDQQDKITELHLEMDRQTK